MNYIYTKQIDTKSPRRRKCSICTISIYIYNTKRIYEYNIHISILYVHHTKYWSEIIVILDAYVHI